MDFKMMIINFIFNKRVLFLSLVFLYGPLLVAKPKEVKKVNPKDASILENDKKLFQGLYFHPTIGGGMNLPTGQIADFLKPGITAALQVESHPIFLIKDQNLFSGLGIETSFFSTKRKEFSANILQVPIYLYGRYRYPVWKKQKLKIYAFGEIGAGIVYLRMDKRYSQSIKKEYPDAKDQIYSVMDPMAVVRLGSELYWNKMLFFLRIGVLSHFESIMAHYLQALLGVGYRFTL